MEQLAREKRATPAQLALAWVLSRGPDIVPVVGARTRAQLAESLAALRLDLTADDLSRLQSTIDPARVAGTRYDDIQMRMLDSERP